MLSSLLYFCVGVPFYTTQCTLYRVLMRVVKHAFFCFFGVFFGTLLHAAVKPQDTITGTNLDISLLLVLTSGKISAVPLHRFAIIATLSYLLAGKNVRQSHQTIIAI